jgi:hypothetical protein
VGSPALFSDWLKASVYGFIIMNGNTNTQKRAFLDDGRIVYCAEVCDLR